MSHQTISGLDVNVYCIISRRSSTSENMDPMNNILANDALSGTCENISVDILNIGCEHQIINTQNFWIGDKNIYSGAHTVTPQ
ncbi:hypothetical protein PNOK_0160400 [Pyrrhoderma noxium]|uniref:Uncharacterized protein n=1 Tax=Pyrrhoderma noxium TaxID=2282107 RepID=A0A286UPX9_9AGAM|nr:hypothetical protein PNOK_0160400 [Pyrrhoderma noxium]